MPADHLDLTALDWSKWSKAEVVALANGMFRQLVLEHGVTDRAEAVRWGLPPCLPMYRPLEVTP